MRRRLGPRGRDLVVMPLVLDEDDDDEEEEDAHRHGARSSSSRDRTRGGGGSGSGSSGGRGGADPGSIAALASEWLVRGTAARLGGSAGPAPLQRRQGAGIVPAVSGNTPIFLVHCICVVRQHGSQHTDPIVFHHPHHSSPLVPLSSLLRTAGHDSSVGLTPCWRESWREVAPVVLCRLLGVDRVGEQLADMGEEGDVGRYQQLLRWEGDEVRGLPPLPLPRAGAGQGQGGQGRLGGQGDDVRVVLLVVQVRRGRPDEAVLEQGEEACV